MEAKTAWDDILSEYRIVGARIVAIIKDGGALVETCDLTIAEGRHPRVLFPKEEEPVSLLAFETAFSVSDQPVGEAGESVEASIVITGTHQNGSAIEIRGDGWVGFNERGNVEGRFDSPPLMLVDEHLDADDDSEVPGKQMTEDEWRDWNARTQPKPSEQHIRALRGRTLFPDE
jgi:hypothetical protein